MCVRASEICIPYGAHISPKNVMSTSSNIRCLFYAYYLHVGTWKAVRTAWFRLASWLACRGDIQNYWVSSPPYTWGRKQIHFPKHCVFYSLEYRPMEKVQKPSNSLCYTPSSEPFKIHRRHVPPKCQLTYKVLHCFISPKMELFILNLV
jgi:hypothetical protein